jgi:hypothetical protein
MTWLTPPPIERPQHLAGVQVAWFEVQSIEDDYLVCWMLDAAGTPIEVDIPVAKLELFRVTPYDGQTINGLTYDYTDDQTRERDDGAETVTERIQPAYYEGALILAAMGVKGGTQLEDAPDWQALADGRAWVPDSESEGIGAVYTTKAVATANITLSGTQTIDGQSIGVGDKVLVSAQTTTSANGVYTCASGAWTKVCSFASGDATIVLVRTGSSYKETTWFVTAANTVKASAGVYK